LLVLSRALTPTLDTIQKSIDEREQQAQVQVNEVEEMARAVEAIQQEQFGFTREHSALQAQARENSVQLC